MKIISIRSALQAVLLLFLFSAFSAASQAQDAVDISKRSLKAKIDYCEVCHGLSGRGLVGFYPIPRLAGQPVEYIENQLKGFVERKRASTASPAATNIMFRVGHALSPAMIKALAMHFHDLNPKPLGGAPRDKLDAGKKIYHEGIESADMPPCASCHGSTGEGDGVMPRLAGQLYPYVVEQLVHWSHERQGEHSDIMAPIAHGLTKSQIEAVAAYVSYLE
jgi:cytochrome c553